MDERCSSLTDTDFVELHFFSYNNNLCCSSLTDTDFVE